jgi:hypothetical protein
MDYLVRMLIIGVGATLLMDLWGIARKLLFGIPSPDYALVGRWLCSMARGRFRHDSIAVLPSVPGERLIGWSAHYLIGIAFAAVLLLARGFSWIQRPTLIPALLVGIASVAAPFFLMQPSMGAGIAGCRTPRPGAVRLQSLITHTVFGLGLYFAGWVANLCYAASA